MPELATKRNCTGCMACVDACPKSALSAKKNADGFRYITCDHNKCIECKLCEKVCPAVNGYVYGENDISSKFYAAWSKNILLRDNGATSGLAGSLAFTVIKSGGYVAGAVMDGLDCKYILTNNLNDLSLIQGSKYTNSNPIGIYKEIKLKLIAGYEVLFTGLGCHCAALLSYLPKKLHDKLYVVDIICGGVPSSLLIDNFQKKENDQIQRIVSFRNKQAGWKPQGFRYQLTYLLKDGSIMKQISGSRNLITDGFACGLTNRYSCYNCKFAYISRKSDITVGDLWGDKDFSEEHFNGVSSVVVHSEKGWKLLQNSDVTINSVAWDKVVKPNYRMFYGI